MSTRVRMHLLTAATVLAVVSMMLMPAPPAYANYEYDCGPHRNAMCHEEPRAEQACSAGCLGRCGPGCDWTVLGNAYTNACANHDNCVRGKRCAGQSAWSAHSQCAGSLPAAVLSYGQTHWNNGFQHAKDTFSGLWKKVKACCN